MAFAQSLELLQLNLTGEAKTFGSFAHPEPFGFMVLIKVIGVFEMPFDIPPPALHGPECERETTAVKGDNILDRPLPATYNQSMEGPRTLQEAIIHYNDHATCHQFMMSLRWPDGKVTCPRCGSDHVVYLPNPKVWKCYGKHDHAKFSLKTGTIFEDSPLHLSKWLTAVWMLTGDKNGISSYEIHRGLGVTQKTAWFMMYRIRLALQTGSFTKAAGQVEVDETFIGGKARNIHKHTRTKKITGTGGKDKTMVVGVLERGGTARTTVIESRKKLTLQTHVKTHVEPGAEIFTDALNSYDGLNSEYVHQVVDHAVEYVKGHVHTNGMENFWNVLKRTINGTYISVEPFHLFRSLDEQVFRYNERHENDFVRFRTAMKNTYGRRWTYKEVTGKTPCNQVEHDK